MPGRDHIIRKQVIDLDIDGRLSGQDIQERVSRLFNDRLISLIENYLDRIDSPPGTTQIPLLEIDLGVIKAEKLEELFEMRLEQEINVLIEDAESSYEDDVEPARTNVVPEEQTDLILVACFLETGTFPWWQKNGTTELFIQALRNILKKETQPGDLLRILFAEATAIKRLVYTIDDRLLREIAAIISGNDHAVKEALDEITFQRVYRVFQKKLTPSVFRKIWWTDLLTFSLHQSWAKGKEAPQLISLFFELQVADKKIAAQQNLLSYYREQLAVLDKLLVVFAPAAVENGRVKQDIPALQQYFNTMRSMFNIKEADAKNKAQSSAEHSGSNIKENTQNHTSAKNKEIDEQPERDAGTSGSENFSDIDKLYIQNAGLVLLWPYLPRLFNILELTNDNEFINGYAAVKACLVLQYLAQGEDLELFEPMLPLNKLLAGIGVFDPVDLQTDELTPGERETCNDMLGAVIANFEMWKGLSVDSLRSAYMQREGIISERDGHWVLQVQRETFDVILDRLPWGKNIIKLPWMTDLIYVEW